MANDKFTFEHCDFISLLNKGPPSVLDPNFSRIDVIIKSYGKSFPEFFFTVPFGRPVLFESKLKKTLLAIKLRGKNNVFVLFLSFVFYVQYTRHGSHTIRVVKHKVKA